MLTVVIASCVHYVSIGVREILDNRQHSCFGNSLLDIKEFYPFMNVEVTDTAAYLKSVAMQPPPTKYLHQIYRETLTAGKFQFAKHSLEELNETLRPIEAKATLESQILCVSPLDGASDLANWKDEVKRLCGGHFDNYRERICSSSGPISMEEEKPEGLWMGSSPQQTQRPRSARQYQQGQHTNQGNRWHPKASYEE